MKEIIQNAIARRGKTIKFMKGFSALTKLFAIILIAISIFMAASLTLNGADSRLAVNMYLTLFAATAIGYQYHIAKDYIDDLEKRNLEDARLLYE